MEKVKVSDEVWDIKKILVFVVILGFFAFGFKTLVLDKKISTNSIVNSSQVQGISAESDSLENFSPKQEIQKGVEDKLSELKKEVSSLNVVDVATSTPAVQKILNDLKNLQSLPQRQACLDLLKWCNGF